MSTRTSPTANADAGANSFVDSSRPTVLGTSGVVSTGHYLATAAGAVILARGGNAVDAGVAAGLCLNVVHNDMNTLSGVAPIVLHHAASNRTITLAGIGSWPARTDREALIARHGGIPDTLERCVVPAAASSWLKALRLYGTMSLAEVSEAARGYARDGFPVHRFMNRSIGSFLANYRRWEENRRIFLRDGDPPPVGTLIRQPDLHRTLESLVAAEAGGSTREDGLARAEDHFYRGPIAEAIAGFAHEHGGTLSADDMASFEAKQAPPATTTYGRWGVAACGPWSQGPTLPLALNLLRGRDLASLGHNSAAYIGVVASALDLAFADRNAYFGDPDFVEVPLDALLSEDYARVRAELIPTGAAFSAPPPPGDPYRTRAASEERRVRTEHFGTDAPRPPADTSCVTVADRDGNLFAATPSDGYCNGPIIPGLGLHISERGSQSFLDPADPNVVAPGKRPRLTPNPALLFRDGAPYAAMATPGNDRQVQAMLQVFLNLAVFGMTPQAAVEAPRFASYNFRASSWPGNTEPGRICLEGGISDGVAAQLEAWGRNVLRWPAWCWSAGGVGLSILAPSGLREGAADPRRESYAIAQ